MSFSEEEDIAIADLVCFIINDFHPPNCDIYTPLSDSEGRQQC